MTETADEVRTEQGAADSTPGELLRSAREQQRLTVHQAAEELHLDPWVIEAIEANRFASLGAPVYARGHLRKYATVLGLDPEPLLECYAQLSDTPALPAPAPITPARIERIPIDAFVKPLLGLVLAGVAAGAGWWIIGRQSSAPDASPSPIVGVERTLEASPEPLIGASDPDFAPAPGSFAEEIGASMDPQEAPSQPARGAAAPAPEAGHIRLRLQFSDSSWTEVYDAAGERLMYGLGSAGRVHTLSGRAPLQVTLGAASAVSAEVNGEKIVVPRRAGRNASKFTIEATGAVSAESG